MGRWFKMVGKRALLVGALLALGGFATIQLLRKALQFQAVDVDTSLEAPILSGVILGGSGLVLVFVFEAIGAGWRWLRGTPSSTTPKTEAAA